MKGKLHPENHGLAIQTTQIYLHADMAMKEKALARATKSKVVPKRYRPTDQVLAYLESL